MNKINSIKKLRTDSYVVEIQKGSTVTAHIISENTVIKYDLLNKESITNDAYQKMIQNNEYELLYLKAIHYISYQMRTISEVKKHLRKNTQKEELIQNIIQDLKRKRYLNDNDFVKEYINEKIEFDFVGPKYIKEKLITKGIHYDLIRDGLLIYNDSIQYDKIYTLLTKELRYKLKKPYAKVYTSLKHKLLTKGFDSHIIESSLLSRKEDILQMIDEEDLLQKDYEKLKDKYDVSKYEEKNKLTKKLITKGHNYELVKELLEKEGN